MEADLMESFKKPLAVGLLPHKEYGIEFHLKLTNEAIELASKKNWKTAIQIQFPGLVITYSSAYVEMMKAGPTGWVTFEVSFTAPYATKEEPIAFNTVGQLITDYVSETLGCGNLDTVEGSWISARIGKAGEVSDFFYKGYQGGEIGADTPISIGDQLSGIWDRTEKVGRFAVVVVGAILAMKVVDVVRK